MKNNQLVLNSSGITRIGKGENDKRQKGNEKKRQRYEDINL